MPTIERVKLCDSENYQIYANAPSGSEKAEGYLRSLSAEDALEICIISACIIAVEEAGSNFSGDLC